MKTLDWPKLAVIDQLATQVNKNDRGQYSGCQPVSRNARSPSKRLLEKKIMVPEGRRLDVSFLTYKCQPKSTSNHLVPEYKN